MASITANVCVCVTSVLLDTDTVMPFSLGMLLELLFGELGPEPGALLHAESETRADTQIKHTRNQQQCGMKLWASRLLASYLPCRASVSWRWWWDCLGDAAADCSYARLPSASAGSAASGWAQMLKEDWPGFSQRGATTPHRKKADEMFLMTSLYFIVWKLMHQIFKKHHGCCFALPVQYNKCQLSAQTSSGSLNSLANHDN